MSRIGRKSVTNRDDAAISGLPTPSSSMNNRPYAANSGLRVWEGLLLTGTGQVQVPKDSALRTTIMAEAHDPIVSGHFGVEKTLEKVTRH